MLEGKTYDQEQREDAKQAAFSEVDVEKLIADIKAAIDNCSDLCKDVGYTLNYTIVKNV